MIANRKSRRLPKEGTIGEPTLVLELLNYAARTKTAVGADPNFNPHWESIDDRQLRMVIDAGLTPLLYHATRNCVSEVPERWHDVLKSAELTALVQHGSLIDATNEVIGACRELGVHITLLKGISISDQFYPVAHARPMGDIDILVEEHVFESVELAILRCGYRRKPHHQASEDSHHGVPLFHPERRVWVEVHTALFRKGLGLRSNNLFSPSQVATQTVASTFHGKPVFRLTSEMQLVYLASSWMRDLCRNTIHPSFVINLLDAIYLLEASGTTLDWDGMLDWMDSELAITSLYIMLHFLSRHGLDKSATQALSRFASRQNIVGALEIRMIDAILDSHLIGNRSLPRAFSDWHASIILAALLSPGPRATKLMCLPWKVIFPPGIADRYSAKYQLERIRRLLRRIH